MLKELRPIVDKPLIQYAAEDAIAAGIDALIFVTGGNKRAIEDHFDSNRELETALPAKGKIEQANMARNILRQGVECIFVRQPEQLGLGHAVLCAERAVSNDLFAMLLANDFWTFDGAGVTADLVKSQDASGRTQLSVMEVNGHDISKYGVVKLGVAPGSVSGLFENLPLSGRRQIWLQSVAISLRQIFSRYHVDKRLVQAVRSSSRMLSTRRRQLVTWKR